MAHEPLSAGSDEDRCRYRHGHADGGRGEPHRCQIRRQLQPRDRLDKGHQRRHGDGHDGGDQDRSVLGVEAPSWCRLVREPLSSWPLARGLVLSSAAPELTAVSAAPAGLSGLASRAGSLPPGEMPTCSAQRRTDSARNASRSPGCSPTMPWSWPNSSNDTVPNSAAKAMSPAAEARRAPPARRWNGAARALPGRRGHIVFGYRQREVPGRRRGCPAARWTRGRRARWWPPGRRSRARACRRSGRTRWDWPAPSPAPRRRPPTSGRPGHRGPRPPPRPRQRRPKSHRRQRSAWSAARRGWRRSGTPPRTTRRARGRSPAGSARKPHRSPDAGGRRRESGG
jgi:hypothetical protein